MPKEDYLNCFAALSFMDDHNDDDDGEATANQESDEEGRVTRIDKNIKKITTKYCHFLLGSKTTCHMVNNAKLLKNMYTYSCDIEIANGVHIKALAKGRLKLKYSHDIILELENVLYAPKLCDCHLSISKLNTEGWSALFQSNSQEVILWKKVKGEKAKIISSDEDHYVKFKVL